MSTSLRDALAERIDAVAPAHPDLAVLVGLGEARLRRRRTTAVLGSGAIAALVAIAVVLAGTQIHHTPQPANRPSLIVPGGEVIAPHPYLWYGSPVSVGGLAAAIDDWNGVRQMGAAPHKLRFCGNDPRTWGAVASQVAVYANPKHPDMWFNEYLLQYPDASSAHGAFLAAGHHMKACPQPRHGSDRTWFHPRPDGQLYDEAFSWLHVPGINQHLYYGRGVALLGNVVLVLDTSIWNDDGRIPQWLSQAVDRAVPHAYYSK